MAKNSEDAALIAAKNLEIAKLKHQIYGHRSERSARLIDQMALQFEEAAANTTEDELAAERAVAKTTAVAGFTRNSRERNTFPEQVQTVINQWLKQYNQIRPHQALGMCPPTHEQS